MGYLFSVIASLFFTAYVIPKKLSAQTPVRYSLFQGMAFFAAALAAYAAARLTGGAPAETLADPILIVSALAGVVWFAACMSLLTAIDRIGLSRSNQWKNLQGPIGAALSLIFLSEYAHVHLFYLVLASVLILVSAVLFTIPEAGERGVDRTGVAFSLLSALLFGVYATLQKLVTNHGLIYAQQVCISGAVLFSAAVYLLLREGSLACVRETFHKESLPGLAGGVLFFFASFFATTAYKYLPVSIAFTIIQLNAVWTVLAGILIFREVDFQTHRARIVLGMTAAVAGVVMLMAAQK